MRNPIAPMAASRIMGLMSKLAAGVESPTSVGVGSGPGSGSDPAAGRGRF